MNPQKRQQQRAEHTIAELEKAIAEADAAIAQSKRFFAGEGADLKRELDKLSPEMKARIDSEVEKMMKEIELETERAWRMKMFEQSMVYRPRNSRRLV
ncbi:hypothetical protein [Lacisediminimonas profundi]|uniref:hypothetical protein n=1 Tax=Lacisediminimonas profundi TaxID=2603856 RepID=UPI00138766EA|nr:hypothetical protein [Lacisediminimonas profundi]